MSDSSTQRLDVEDDDQRQRRLRQLLQRINDSRSGSTTASSNNGPGPSSSLAEASGPAPGGEEGVRETHPVEPPKELLARLEAFLPEMAASTSELAQRAEEAPDSVDIEHLEGSEREYIEMNLGIGLFDLQRRPSSEVSSSSSSHSSSHSPSDDGGSSSSSASDSDASSSVQSANLHERPIRPLPNRARPLIVVLDDQSGTSNPP